MSLEGQGRPYNKDKIHVLKCNGDGYGLIYIYIYIYIFNKLCNKISVVV